MINKIKNIFKSKPKFLKENQYNIEKIFTNNGKDYYSFKDSFNVPYERALTALTYYEEFRMRCTREYLQKHVEATDALINSKTIKLTEVAKLNNQLKERLEWIIEPELIYKLASVIIFDSNESPYVYDFKYNQAKISEWKENKEILSFFLQLPIMNVIPYLNDLELNLEAYSELVERVKTTHLENILSIKSENLN
jgi:hypothetical protein